MNAVLETPIADATCYCAQPVWVQIARGIIRCLPIGRFRAIARVPRAAPFIGDFSTGAGDVRFVADFGDRIARIVYFANVYEPQESAFFKQSLRRGMTALDIGANWGYFSLLAAKLVGPSGRVISIEPDPRLYQRFRDNIDLNAFDNITPVQAAASSEDGVARLIGYDDASDYHGGSRLCFGEESGVGTASFGVRTVAVDGLLEQAGIEFVDLAKIDTEGAELAVLRGMHRHLAQGKIRRILLELHPHLSDRPAVIDVLEPLIRAGYRGWWVNHHGAAERRAWYSGSVPFAEYLTPFEGVVPARAWPHMLWLAPGERLS